MTHRTIAAGLGGLTLVGGLVAAGTALTGADASTPAASSHATSVAAHSHYGHSKTVSGRFVALNNSGVTGVTKVTVKGRWAHVRIWADGLAPNLPHAQHIHFSADTTHMCPTTAQDTNNDGRVNVAEGAVTYGAIVSSLTTKGDTSPDSALAVDRFPTTPNGSERYNRWIKVDGTVAKAIRTGEAHIVLHGVDFNANGTYDFDSAGASEIAPTLPAEATDPAACAELG